MKISLPPLYETVQWRWQVYVVLYQQRLGFDPRPIHVELVEKVSLDDDGVLCECFSIPPRNVIPTMTNSHSFNCQRRHMALPIARDVK